MKQTLEDRFWSKVQRGPANICWPWTKNTHPKWGYGRFRWTNPDTGKSEIANAHRVAFYLTYGYLPEMGCHDCDNPPCCNPGHLYDGNAATNGADKAARGRARGKGDRQRGERNDFAVLTDQIVVQARLLAAQGIRHQAIADRLGVDRPALSYAISGKTWSHLNDIAPPVKPNRGGSRLSDDDIRNIRATAAQGLRQKDLAMQYDVSTATISLIVSRRTHTHID